MVDMKWRHFFFFLAVVLLVVLVINQFGQIEKFIATLKHVLLYVLVLVLPLRYLYYRQNARYFEAFFGIFNEKTRFPGLFRAVTAMNFVNIIFPSGGISGVSYLRKTLGRDISSPTITLAQVFYYALLFAALIMSLFVAFVLLLLSNQVIKISSRITLLILFMILVGTIAIAVFIINKKFTKETIVALLRPANWFLRRLHKKPIAASKISGFVDEFHDSLLFLRDNWTKLIKPFWHIMLMLFCDFVSVYIIFLAFRTWVNPGVVIAGFVLAQAASLAAILTAGVGVFEAAMIATFVGLGVGFDLAFSVTIVYRSISLWLFIPVGVYLYKRGILDGD